MRCIYKYIKKHIFKSVPQKKIYFCSPKLKFGTIGRCSSEVEHFLGKEGVTSSTLVNGSKIEKQPLFTINR